MPQTTPPSCDNNIYAKRSGQERGAVRKRLVFCRLQLLLLCMAGRHVWSPTSSGQAACLTLCLMLSLLAIQRNPSRVCVCGWVSEILLPTPTMWSLPLCRLPAQNGPATTLATTQEMNSHLLWFQQKCLIVQGRCVWMCTPRTTSPHPFYYAAPLRVLKSLFYV